MGFWSFNACSGSLSGGGWSILTQRPSRSFLTAALCLFFFERSRLWSLM